MLNEAKKILQKYWGYSDFRPDQTTVIQSVLSKTDTLAILPTGGGKSICYQVPGLLFDGMVIVISPLIALMNDQVEGLKKVGVSAIAITSNMNYREVDIALENCVYNKYKFLYVSPERVNSDLFQQRFREMNISFIAIDEAHCISQWGFDFRPSYLKLNLLRELQPNTPILALTASAPEIVTKDIIKYLELKNHTLFQGNFSRPNLSYYFIKSEDKSNKIKQIFNKVKGSGIIYTYTRKQAREFSKWLNAQGLKSNFYHGGLSYEEREKSRLAWMNNTDPIMCATNAFGMGIDKPDVKIVAHSNLPLSVEAYYQEAGRAGRNGEKAWAILLYNDSDLIDLKARLSLSFPELKVIKQVYKMLSNYYFLPPGTGGGKSFLFEITEFCNRYNTKPVAVYNAIKFLEKEGYIMLSAASRSPSRVYINSSQKALYSYSLTDKVMGKTIDVLLRSYTGLFDDFQTINETLVAQRIQVDRKQIVKHLRQLNKLELITYREQSESPWLTFTEDVASEQNLRISPENYHNLKVRAFDRLEKFTQIITSTSQCRNVSILSYFGIQENDDCGICDICLSKTKRYLTDDKYKLVSNKIIQLSEKGHDNSAIIESFPSDQQKVAKHILRFLLDEEIL